MISQTQIEQAQHLLQDAFEGHIKDELRYMLEHDAEGLFCGLCEEDFCLKISVKVEDASTFALASWSSLLKAMAKQDYEAFRNFEDYCLVDCLDVGPYKRLIDIHSKSGDTNSLFYDALVQAALVVVDADDNGNQYEVDFVEEGARVSL